MNEKEQIIDIVNNYPKHYAKMIANTKELWEWVVDNSLVASKNKAEMIYSAINQITNTCYLGNDKVFSGINTGYRFCNRTKHCQCAKDSVSKKVSAKKASRNQAQIIAENEKREQTSLLRYGVINNAQTSSAKLAHKDFYSNHENVTKVIDKVKKTKKDRYNDPNYNNRVKAEATTLTKHNVVNPWLTRANNSNPLLDLLRNKNELESLYPKYTVSQIAEQCNVHIQTVYRYLGLHGLRDPYRSTFEDEIVTFFKSIGVTNIVTNTRKLIGKEIDIYLPDYNIAIEYNGEYWHHDLIPHITRSYHYDKFKKCEDLGIRLFTIFGDSWNTSKEIWKLKFKAILGKVDTRVYARNTTVVALSNSESKKILNNNHVQGYCNAQHCYGLMYNDKIVAVMSFSKSRSGIGKNRGAGAYELVRYVTSQSVVGGASKLLKYFIKHHSPKLIISYSDNRYSSGNLYQTLGFTMERENKCGYWYYDPNTKKTFHRYKFTKHFLVSQGFDKSKTEREITREMGLLKIYDCGTRTWVLQVL